MTTTTIDYLSREAWGATADVARDRAGKPLLVRRPAKELWVHHSVTNPDDDEVYEATDDVARDMRELERIGVSRFGRFSYSWAAHPSGWAGEGAGLTVGAHTANRNSTSFGVVAIGNYQTNRCPDTIVHTIAGIAVDLVRGGHLDSAFKLDIHRHAPGAATACPGQHLIKRVPEIRYEIDALLAPPPLVVPLPTPDGGDSFPNAVHAAMAPDGGVWVLGTDGGVGAYRAPFYGSLPGLGVVATATSLLPTPTEAGYWIMTSDGGIFTFGDAEYHGSYPGLPPEGRLDAGTPRRFVALVGRPGGYVELADDGGPYAFP